MLPHFVLLGLHLFSCFYVGWDINSFQGVKRLLSCVFLANIIKQNTCLCDDTNLRILFSKKPLVKVMCLLTCVDCRNEPKGYNSCG
jgi:hypothetical protein